MPQTFELDATGLICPMPVLKARRKLACMKTGDTLVLTATDTSASYDVPNFCTQSGHKLVSRRQMGRIFTFKIIKGSDEEE